MGQRQSILSRELGGLPELRRGMVLGREGAAGKGEPTFVPALARGLDILARHFPCRPVRAMRWGTKGDRAPPQRLPEAPPWPVSRQPADQLALPPNAYPFFRRFPQIRARASVLGVVYAADLQHGKVAPRLRGRQTLEAARHRFQTRSEQRWAPPTGHR